MTNKLSWLTCLGLLAVSAALAQTGKAVREEATLEQMVARLGTHGNDDVADVEQLAKDGSTSAGLLVAALHTIPDSAKYAKADESSMEHALWLIRALRYMTGGKDFCAPTRHVFGTSEEEQNRKYWLSLAHKNCLTFFGFWPSRGRWYIAPPDTQEEIIAQWRRWYSSQGKVFEYKPLRNPPPEKWLW